MSYKVLARRWRPKTFGEVMGQQTVAVTLKNAVKSGRIAHAYLFTGPRGVGKTSCARILAKSLNCTAAVEHEPCGTCTNCVEISGGVSVDTIEIDGASNNGVDDIRNITENIKFAPYQSKYKVYIVDEVHMLSTPAFNALLKTLEEPPEHAVCYDFRRIPFSTIRENLTRISKEENISIDQESLNMISEMSDGSMRDAQTLMEQVISSLGTTIELGKLNILLSVIDRRLLFTLLESVVSGRSGDALAAVAAVYDKGFDIVQCYGQFMKLFRSLFVIKFSDNSAEMLTAPVEEIAMLREMGEKISVEDFHRMGKILMDAEASFKRTDTPRMLLEMVVLRMIHLKRMLPVEELLGRLGGASPGLSASSKSHNVQHSSKQPVSAEPMSSSGASDSAIPYRFSFDKTSPASSFSNASAPEGVQPASSFSNAPASDKHASLSSKTDIPPVERQNYSGEDFWERFKTELAKEKKFLHDQIKNFKYVGINVNIIRIQTSEMGSFARDNLLEAGNKQIIERIASSLYGERLTLEVDNVETESQEYLQNIEKERQNKRVEEMRQHMLLEPQVKNVLKIFEKSDVDTFKVLERNK